MTMLSETSVALGDTPRAARLYELLLPYADRNVTANTAIACFGSVSYFLGRLATLMSRWEDAARRRGCAGDERADGTPSPGSPTRCAPTLTCSSPVHTVPLQTSRERGRCWSKRWRSTPTRTWNAAGPKRSNCWPTGVWLPIGRSRAYPDRLTEREVEVLRLVAAGGTNREIADRLFLSVRTVERHIGNVYAKTGVHDRRSARVYALRHGLIDVAGTVLRSPPPHRGTAPFDPLENAYRGAPICVVSTDARRTPPR